jgi:hypothetical protein
MCRSALGARRHKSGKAMPSGSIAAVRPRWAMCGSGGSSRRVSFLVATCAVLTMVPACSPRQSSEAAPTLTVPADSAHLCKLLDTALMTAISKGSAQPGPAYHRLSDERFMFSQDDQATWCSWAPGTQLAAWRWNEQVSTASYDAGWRTICAPPPGKSANARYMRTSEPTRLGKMAAYDCAYVYQPTHSSPQGHTWEDLAVLGKHGQFECIVTRSYRSGPPPLGAARHMCEVVVSRAQHAH